MAMQYINQIRAKAQSTRAPKKPPRPVLTKEDEAFLSRVTSHPEEGSASASEQQEGQGGKDPQVALMDGAQDIPLPISPPEEPTIESGGLDVVDKDEGAKSPEQKPAKEKGRNPWSWIKKRKVSYMSTRDFLETGEGSNYPRSRYRNQKLREKVL